MEDSIIFNLIERSQYKINASVYAPNCEQLGEFKLHQLKCAGSSGCLGDWFIYRTECLHAQVGRYQHPTEYAFFGPLPEPTLRSPAPLNQAILAPVPPEAVLNAKLLGIYRSRVVPAMCEVGDDGNHGSTAVQDVACLQAMGTRIYYGLVCAESKFLSERGRATELIRAGDREGLMEFITVPEIEVQNVQRVILKARTFGQDIPAGEAGQLAPEVSEGTKRKVDPEYIGAVFRDFLIPLTKEVQVEYLMARLSHG